MSWDTVVGHATHIARLRRVAAADRPAGAYLFVGPDGIGKRTLANAFAAHLLCGEPARQEPCATCSQCVRVASGVHPDLLVTTRDSDRRDMRVEQVRDVTKWLTLRPLMARRKVAIIDGADDLNDHGQNALLRTLEEPPGAAILLLTARSNGLLLPTVRSRCQAVRLEVLDPSEIAALLQARGVPADRAAGLVARAQGVPGRAIALAEQDDPEQRGRLLDLLTRLSEIDAGEISAAAQDIAKGDVADGMSTVVGWYRDVLERAANADRPPRNLDRASAIEATASRLPLPAVLAILERTCATITDIEHNANRALAIETLLLAARTIERSSGV